MFGKSLLVSTLAAVFEGRRDLFEAFTTDDGIEQPQLFIAQIDWRWEKHPVIRFDFSSGDLQTIEQLDTLIDQTLKYYERIYVIELKYDHTAQEALDQINRKGYAEKYSLERQRVGDGTSGIGRPVTKVGIAFSSEERNITEWKAEPLV